MEDASQFAKMVPIIHLIINVPALEEKNGKIILK